MELVRLRGWLRPSRKRGDVASPVVSTAAEKRLLLSPLGGALGLIYVQRTPGSVRWSSRRIVGEKRAVAATAKCGSRFPQ